MAADRPEDSQGTVPPLREELLDALWTRTHGDDWAEVDPDATCLPDVHALEAPSGLRQALGRSGGHADDLTGAAPTMIPELDDDSVPTGGTAVPLPEESGSDLASHLHPTRIDFGPLIGEGGLARVYRASQVSLDRSVAVKVVRRQASQRRFLYEARITAALDHPNVLPVHDLVSLEDGAPALVMKEVVGVSWRQHIDRVQAAGSYELVNEIRTLLAVCQAIAFAHDRGVLHLDLKPGNVMVGGFGEVLVMDWGCAVISEESMHWRAQPDLPRATWIRSPFGTPTYMPPELARGEGDRVGPASDIYLLGAILVELLLGHRPRRGVSAAAIVKDAADGIIRRPPEDAPEVLAALARDALQPDPADRPASVTAFRDRLQHWLDTREARRIVHDARRRLLAAEARIAGLGVIRQRDVDPEEEIFELIGAFQQARLLWDQVPGGADGEHRARRMLAFRALNHEDAGLAAAQARHLPADDPERDEILGRASQIREARERTQRNSRRQRHVLIGAGVILAVVAAVGFMLVESSRTRAELAAQRARDSLTQIERLSDHEQLRELIVAAEGLYPAEPGRVPALESWLDQAASLLQRHASHTAALQTLGEPQSGESLDVRWRRRILGELDEGLRRLAEEVVPAVEGRLLQARTLHADSIEAHDEAWRRACAEVADDSRFEGFELRPQLGLVPLGPDPDSGLQRFAHLLTGAVPRLDEAGRVRVRAGDGVVLVLIPGGRVPMGAAPDDPVHADPMAKPIEGPAHELVLDPYFLAMHELTQDQYARIMWTNPSAYPPGYEIGGHTVSVLHPVEQVRRADAAEALRRVGLVLPTEAQWERAARGGTTSVFWTGDAPASLDGAANLADAWAAAHEGPESWRYEPFLNDGHTVHAPVGSLRPNPFGLYDTAGNVWEWCGDDFARYDVPTEEGSGRRLAPEGAPGVFRGGGFRATVVHARSADRYSLYADDYRAYDVGVRAARAVSGP